MLSPDSFSFFKFQSDSINTVHAFLVSVAWDNFKFQSDSINTEFRLWEQSQLASFKFQSDSINTPVSMKSFPPDSHL